MRRLIPAFALFALLMSTVGCSATTAEGTRSLPLEVLKDKIRGGWVGQMIGVSYGAPTEFRYRGRTIPDHELPDWKPEYVRLALRQDDLYVDITLASVLDTVGLHATTEDFARAFAQTKYPLWHANLAARRNLQRGVAAGDSGTLEWNAHALDIDFQIEADFVGLMTPGLPNVAVDYALRAGRVMNSGDGLLGGVFVSCMYAAAFFEADPEKVVTAGLSCLPPQSQYAQLIRDVLEWWHTYPQNWRRTWELIEEKWNQEIPCPASIHSDFNIDAKLNGAYIVLGLLYGGGQWEETIRISTQAGQDSDCNPANAAGILGTMLGYSRIPARWSAGIADIAEEKFLYTEYSLDTIVEKTYERAIRVAELHDGRRQGDRLVIPVQQPSPASIDPVPDPGQPVAIVPVSDPKWQWSGQWHEDAQKVRGRVLPVKVSDQAGATARIRFRGEGAMLRGALLPDGGQFEVYLDGELHRRLDAASGEAAVKNFEAIWHSFELPAGEHRLELKVLGKPGLGSNGSKVMLQDLVVFD